MNNKFVIMFVCTGNTCRSAMASGAMRVLLEKEHSGKYEVISSGTHAATDFPATQYAIEAAKIWEADISDHASQPLTEMLIDKSDLIFAMTPSHARQAVRLKKDASDKIYLLKNFPDNVLEGEGVEDPIGQALDRYNQTFIEIGELLGQYLPEIVKRIDGKIQ